LCELSTDFAIDCALDYIEGQQGEAPDIYYDWLEWQFGKTIADYYMRPYNSKIWAYPLKNMETEWVHGKMPISSKREILASLVNRETAEKNFVHSSFYYPKHGGIQSMVDAIAQPLSDKIRLNTAVGKIEKRGGKWQINGTDEYDVVISTLPIVEMPNMMTLPDEISKAISGLTFNSHTSVLFSCPPTNLHWLYIPESKYKSHRICYQSAACANATPNQSMGSGTLEVIGNKFDIPSDFALDNAVIPQELGAKQQITTAHAEYAYVVHSIGYKKNTEIFRAYFEGVEHFHLLGRWALWHYSNMDINMADAFKLADAYFQKR
jgi:protoporphyrinogen oxidase